MLRVPSGSGAGAVYGAVHRREHVGLLPQSQIVVAAPHGNAPRPMRAVPQSFRKLAREALDLDEGAVTAVHLHVGYDRFEFLQIIHHSLRCLTSRSI